MKFLVIAGVLGSVVFMLYAKWRVARVSEGRMFTKVEAIPVRKTGLVLGCARLLANGRENAYFRYRINAAVELYEAGKVSYLLVSGDNSRPGYNESLDMKQALIEAGVPGERIVCDFAGFSTLDSVVRAKKVFGQAELTVVSQDFHVRRAVYIGEHFGVDVVGYAAKNVRHRLGMRTRAREVAARCKTLLDVHVLGRRPRYLGEPVAIGED